MTKEGDIWRVNCVIILSFWRSNQNRHFGIRKRREVAMEEEHTIIYLLIYHPSAFNSTCLTGHSNDELGLGGCII